MKKLTVIALILSTQSVFADAASSVQEKLNAIRTMSANFSQVVTAKKKQVSQSSGTMALSRPGKFRWQTKNPMPQVVVADGNRLWVYDVDLEQVTVKKQEKGIGGTAGLFLSGYDDTVNRDFTVTETQKGNVDSFDLKAKSNNANFQRVKLTFEGNELKGMELYDQLGQRTKVNLTNVKTNPKLASTMFSFKAPKGVDVVKQ